MCYSFRTSILSYTVGLLSAIFAMYTRQYVLGMLIIFYSQMQLSEAIIWYGIDTDNKEINKTGTTIGKYLLATHNFAIGMGIILNILLVERRDLEPKDLIPVFLGAGFFTFIVLVYYMDSCPSETYPLKKEQMKTCQNSNNRLQWPYPHQWYIYSYLLSMALLIGYVDHLYSKIFLGGIFSILFLYTAIFYKDSVIGSVWCFNTALVAPLIVLGNYMLLGY